MVTDANKELALNKVAISAHHTQLSEIYYQVGKFLYDNRRSLKVRKCIKERKKILAQVNALERSVAYHRSLAKA